MDEVYVDLTPIVVALIEIGPHRRFVDRLKAEGRISGAEIDALDEELAATVAGLPEPVRQRLRGHA